MNEKFEETSPIEISPADQLSIRLEDLGLSIRAYNILKRENINTVGDIVALTPFKLYSLWSYHIGIETSDEIITKVSELGLHLTPDFIPE